MKICPHLSEIRGALLMCETFTHICVRIVDMADPRRVDRDPDGHVVVLDGEYLIHGATVSKVELRLYAERREGETYSVITAAVQVGAHSVEMLYDEGYHGKDALVRAAEFLVSMLGISALVRRALIAMEEAGV